MRDFLAECDPSRNPQFQRRWVDDPLDLPDFQHLGRRHGIFAREMTLAEFRPRDGKALLQTDFIDRAPGQFPLPSPEARTR